MELKTLLMYPPLQFQPGIVAKPDGSLSLPYLAGALRDADFEVSILDASTGNDGEDLNESFFRDIPLSNGLVRVGLSETEILKRVEPYDVIGITSIFTAQATMALNTVGLINKAFPEKSILVGGVNARFMKDRFINRGAHVVFHSESERAIVDCIRALGRNESLEHVPGLSTRSGFTGIPQVVVNLDELPIPAWDLLPNEQYWKIGRPHGGELGQVKYAQMMTSRGCPFDCSYCHISKEKEPGSLSGDIGQYRMKSYDRVMREIELLKTLGVEYVYIEDDSLLAKKKRVRMIFDGLRKFDLKLADVNGVNIAHLFHNNEIGRLEPDTELFDSMRSCGFEKISLPFESGSQRIINKYASKKWVIKKVDTVRLIEEMIEAGLQVDGNYTIGYPDETMEEIKETLQLARLHMEYGLSEANIFLIVPFPGSELFDFAMKNGFLDENWNPDEMKWYEPTMNGTTVPRETLKLTRDLAWSLLNKPDYVSGRVNISVGR